MSMFIIYLHKLISKTYKILLLLTLTFLINVSQTANVVIEDQPDENPINIKYSVV